MSAEADFKRAAARYRKARERLDEARADVYARIPAARKSGLTYDAIAREMGISRQRVMELLKTR